MINYSLSELRTEKEIYLVGEERYMHDFHYVFDDFNIKQLLSDVLVAKTLDITEHTLLIVCARCYEPVLKQLTDVGFIYGINLLLADDIFDTFLSQKNVLGKGIVVWGAGNDGKIFIETHASEIEFVVDNGTALQEICNKKIVRSGDIDLRDYFIIVATSKYWPKIKQELQTLGLKEDLDFTYYESYFDIAQSMKECVSSSPVADARCSYPFEFCQIKPGGYIFLCCLGMNVCIGGIKNQSFQDIWHSRLAKIARLSVINKTFIYCDEGPCPVIKGKRDYAYNEFFCSDDYKTKELMWPNEVNISIDHSCNLSCEHCRKEHFIAGGTEKDEIDRVADRLNDEVIPNVETVVLAGNGEIFFSDTYKKIWRESAPEKRTNISILTNGLLFTPDIWKELKERYSLIGFSVSIDASTEETYKRIRGGNFKLLKKNLEYMSTLRRNGDIWYLHMNFVVRQENINELKEFILWAKELGADRVRVSKVENWVYEHDHFYNNISIFDEDNSLKPEFRKIFRDEILNDPIVELINIKNSYYSRFISETPDIKNDWNRYYNSAEDFVDEHINKYFAPVLDKYNISLKKVLDFPSGRGRMAEGLYKKYSNRVGKIVCCDANINAIEFCQKRFFSNDSFEFTVNKVDETYTLPLEFPSDTFSFIYSWDSMVHFTYKWIDFYIGEFYRLLNVNGFVIIHHSNIGSEDVDIGFAKSENWSENPHGRTLVSHDDVRAIAERYGFIVVEQRVLDFIYKEKGFEFSNMDCITILKKE
jgi:MoaA/NifB/PqqE/SkfB family radical SAM enzyme